MCDFRKPEEFKTVIINGIKYNREAGELPYVGDIVCYGGMGAVNAAKAEKDGIDGMFCWCASGSFYAILLSGEWYTQEGWDSDVWGKWS